MGSRCYICSSPLYVDKAELGLLPQILPLSLLHQRRRRDDSQNSLPCWLGLSTTPIAPLQRGKSPLNECPGYDIKQCNGEFPVMLELWGMWSTPLLPSLPGRLWPRTVASDRVQSMGLIELDGVLMLNWIVWNRTVLTLKLCTYSKLNC